MIDSIRLKFRQRRETKKSFISNNDVNDTNIDDNQNDEKITKKQKKHVNKQNNEIDVENQKHEVKNYDSFSDFSLIQNLHE